MLIAARNGFAAGGKLSAKSYIQDGLVAMWDGIENAGWGVHDASLGKILDLSGNGHDITMPSTWSLGDNYIYCNSRNVNFNITSSELSNIIANGMTAELVIKDIGQEANFGWSAYGGIGVSFKASTNTVLISLAFNNSGGGVGNNGTIYSNFAAASKYNHAIACSAAIGGPCVVYNSGERINYKSDLGAMRGDAYNIIQCFHSWGSTTKESLFYSVRFYSRALTAEEIAANYAVDKARFNLP